MYAGDSLKSLRKLFSCGTDCPVLYLYTVKRPLLRECVESTIGDDGPEGRDVHQVDGAVTEVGWNSHGGRCWS